MLDRDSVSIDLHLFDHQAHHLLSLLDGEKSRAARERQSVPLPLHVPMALDHECLEIYRPALELST